MKISILLTMISVIAGSAALAAVPGPAAPTTAALPGNSVNMSVPSTSSRPVQALPGNNVNGTQALPGNAPTNQNINTGYGISGNTSIYQPPANPMYMAPANQMYAPPAQTMTQYPPANGNAAPTQQLTGQQLNNRISSDLQSLNYDPNRVQVNSDSDGHVRLEGTVNTQSEADALLQRARQSNGGADVIDNLQVQNISQ